ncbi:hypothetical protein OOT46_22370 [Aquabacterium sp. A7-Y]|uniref:hypothetical protein n=1 Tax=Aquabacterium sp. A7-Y TaxID=1349605 RepID=UPI00223E82E1|nr:hypothetical protein [Aquabacterium sp. A7-Y]MCW7540573.1 hypothetical protein [Aquabacterium sp. A7-Y]
MVQVDIFWAWGLGGALAVAAGSPSRALARPLESRYFVTTLLFLALIWAPSGLYLLLRHPSWETMQVAENFASLPAWLVLAFGITNITQGVLGYLVGIRLLRAGRVHLAQLNWLAGHYAMFFVLIYGWDGRGYDRFLYDRDLWPGAPAWSPGAGATLPELGGAVLGFVGSSVGLSLLLCGVFLLPVFLGLMARWVREGHAVRGRPAHESPSAARIVGTVLAATLLLCLGAALFSALVVGGVAGLVSTLPGPVASAPHLVGVLLGLPLSIVLLWFALLRPDGVAARLLAPLTPLGEGQRIEP